MSRAIKFRAWDNDNKEWLNKGDAEDLIILLDGSYEINRGWCIVKPDLTIEQYTGLKDKNGKEIYVGDILETCCGKAEVYFDDELLMYRIKVKHGGTMPLVSKKSKRHFDYEVIGNIHENGELIGGEE